MRRAALQSRGSRSGFLLPSAGRLRAGCAGARGGPRPPPLPTPRLFPAPHPGTPHVEVDIGNKYVIAVAALGMLVAGKPINIRRKEVGGWRLALRLPGSGPSLNSNVSLEPAVRCLAVAAM